MAVPADLPNGSLDCIERTRFPWCLTTEMYLPYLALRSHYTSMLRFTPCLTCHWLAIQTGSGVAVFLASFPFDARREHPRLARCNCSLILRTLSDLDLSSIQGAVCVSCSSATSGRIVSPTASVKHLFKQTYRRHGHAECSCRASLYTCLVSECHRSAQRPQTLPAQPQRQPRTSQST